MKLIKSGALFIFPSLISNSFAQGLKEGEYTVTSPDNKITTTCNPKKAVYRVSYQGEPLLIDSKLGVVREDDDFSENLNVLSVSSPIRVKDSYSILTAKKRNVIYTATERTIETQTISGKKMNIIFRVSNDGVAFRAVYIRTHSLLSSKGNSAGHDLKWGFNDAYKEDEKGNAIYNWIVVDSIID